MLQRSIFTGQAPGHDQDDIMTAITSTPARPSFFADLRGRFRANRETAALRRRTERELSQLDDRHLADLGISRHEIPRIARQAALD